MLTDNSTQSFIRKLCEKEREHTTKFYMESLKDKENISKKSNVKPLNSTHKKMRTESSSTIVSSTPAATQNTPEWALDVSGAEQEEFPELMDEWLSLPEGMCRFHKVYRKGHWEEQISKKIAQCESNEDGRKCITIELNCLDKEVNFTSILTQYSLSLLKFGKSTWSVAALASNRRFDLLSLDCEGAPVWKAKQPLSKVQLQREQLLRRVFGYASQKEKNLNIQEILAKVTLASNNVIYFILKSPEVEQSISKLLIQQEIIIEGISLFQKYPILIIHNPAALRQSLSETLKNLGIQLRKEEELSKSDKESFLKSMINKLEGQLNSQKQELKQYIESEIVEEEQYLIPSERISMSEKYKQLQRNIRASDNQT